MDFPLCPRPDTEHVIAKIQIINPLWVALSSRKCHVSQVGAPMAIWLQELAIPFRPDAHNPIFAETNPVHTVGGTNRPLAHNIYIIYVYTHSVFAGTTTYQPECPHQTTQKNRHRRIISGRMHFRDWQWGAGRDLWIRGHDMKPFPTPQRNLPGRETIGTTRQTRRVMARDFATTNWKQA